MDKDYQKGKALYNIVCKHMFHNKDEDSFDILTESIQQMYILMALEYERKQNESA